MNKRIDLNTVLLITGATLLLAILGAMGYGIGHMNGNLVALAEQVRTNENKLVVAQKAIQDLEGLVGRNCLKEAPPALNAESLRLLIDPTQPK